MCDKIESSLNETEPDSGEPPILLESLDERNAALLGLPVRILDTGVVILLTAIADICLYNAPGGTGAGTLFVLGVVGILCAAWALRKNSHKGLIAVVLLVATASVWNHSWFLSFVGGIALIAFAIKLHRPDWRIIEIAWAVPQTALLAPLRLIGHVLRGTGSAPQRGQATVESGRHFPLRIIIAPLLVSILFVLIFIAANPVIEHMASKVSQQLGEWLDAFSKYITAFRVLAWLCWLLVFAALVRPAIISRTADLIVKWRETLQPSTGPGLTSGDYVAAVVTLFSVNLLFLAFNAVDSVYLYFKMSLHQLLGIFAPWLFLADHCPRCQYRRYRHYL